MNTKLLITTWVVAMLLTCSAKAQNPANESDMSSFFSKDRLPRVSNTASPYNNIVTYNDLLVYPNPVVSVTKVVLDEISAANVYVDVIDMNGHVDRSFQFAPGSDVLTVDMSKLPTGWYSLRVYGKEVVGHNIEVVKE